MLNDLSIVPGYISAQLAWLQVRAAAKLGRVDRAEVYARIYIRLMDTIGLEA